MDEATNGVRLDAAVVGGGLAGLTAGAFLARGGARAAVLEKSSEPGGRARTVEREGFRFNLGPHAYYLEGEGAEAYRELGVDVSGTVPDPSSLRAADAGGVYRFPAGPLALLGNERLDWRDKLDFVAVLTRLRLLDPVDFTGEPIGEWLRRRIDRPVVRNLIGALVRLSTYCDHHDQDAGAVLGQLQMVAGEGAFYVDGGWGALVRALRDRAEAAGAEVRTGTRAVDVRRSDGAWEIRTSGDAGIVTADVVILATGSPGAAVDALAQPPASLRESADAVRPVAVSSLNLGLRRLPRDDRKVVLGTDRPLYASDYASVADVAPENRSLLQTARYGAPGESGEPGGADGPPGGVEVLEAFLDRIQPGWQDEVLVRQPLPRITVAWDRPRPARGGLNGRYGPVVPEAEGLYVVGDWVGPEGMLSDAAVASARRAAETALTVGPLTEGSRARAGADAAR